MRSSFCPFIHGLSRIAFLPVESSSYLDSDELTLPGSHLGVATLQTARQSYAQSQW